MPPVIIMFKVKVTASVTRRVLLLTETNISLAFCIIRVKGFGAVKATLREDVFIFMPPCEAQGDNTFLFSYCLG